MTVTSNSIGTYTTRIVIEGEVNDTAWLAAMDAAIVAGFHWAQYDSLAGGRFRVYRSLNLDGVTYKYASVGVSLEQSIIITAWETWDATLHTGTNPSYTHYGDYYTSFGYFSCELFVYAGPRWLGTSSILSGMATPFPAFVVETTRDHPEDTVGAGYPCWVWTSVGSLGGSNHLTGNGNIDAFPVGPVRLRDGSTGATAAKSTFVTALGMRFGNLAGNVAAYYGPAAGGVTSIPTVSPWGPGFSYTSVIGFGYGQSGYHGKLCSMFLGPPATSRSPMKTDMVLDSNTFLPSAGGVSTPVWLMPPIVFSEVTTLTTLSALTGVAYDLQSDGRGFYVCHATGLGYYNFGTQAFNKELVRALNIKAMKLVGGLLYLVDATNNKVGVMDLTTQQVTWGSGALTSGGITPCGICHDGTDLWVIHNTPVVGVVYFDKVSTSTLNTIASFGYTTAKYGESIFADPFGNVIAVVGRGNSTYEFLKIDKATPAVGSVGLAATSAGNGSNYRYGAQLQWAGVPNVAGTGGSDGGGYSAGIITTAANSNVVEYSAAIAVTSFNNSMSSNPYANIGQPIPWSYNSYGGAGFGGMPILTGQNYMTLVRSYNTKSLYAYLSSATFLTTDSGLTSIPALAKFIGNRHVAGSKTSTIMYTHDLFKVAGTTGLVIPR